MGGGNGVAVRVQGLFRFDVADDHPGATGPGDLVGLVGARNRSAIAQHDRAFGLLLVEACIGTECGILGRRAVGGDITGPHQGCLFSDAIGVEHGAAEEP